MDYSSFELSLYSLDLELTANASPYFVDHIVTLTGVVDSVTFTQQHTLRVKNPCADPSLVEVSTPSPIQIDYPVGSGKFVALLPSDFSASVASCGKVAIRLATIPSAAVTLNSDLT